jgi:hypothetical protein
MVRREMVALVRLELTYELVHRVVIPDVECAQRGGHLALLGGRMTTHAEDLIAARSEMLDQIRSVLPCRSGDEHASSLHSWRS